MKTKLKTSSLMLACFLTVSISVLAHHGNASYVITSSIFLFAACVAALCVNVSGPELLHRVSDTGAS